MTADIRGAVIEVIERRHPGQPPLPDVGPGSILIPTEIRINGQALYCPSDAPPVVERISFGEDRGPVLVTLTVWARRVIIDDAAAEDGPTTDTPLDDPPA